MLFQKLMQRDRDEIAVQSPPGFGVRTGARWDMRPLICLVTFGLGAASAPDP